MRLAKPLFAVGITAVFLLGAVLSPIHKQNTASPRQQESQNKYARAQAQTVLIKASQGQGSGVTFKRQNEAGHTRWFAWTAAHVVTTEKEVQVVVLHRTENHLAGESIFNARVIAVSPEKDVALLWINAPSHAFVHAEMSSAAASPGDEVFAVGNFLGGGNFPSSVSTGVISQLAIEPGLLGWPWEPRQVDQSTCPAFPGSSGGPIFNSAGKVLGLVVGGISPVCMVFVPVRVIVVWSRSEGLRWAVEGDEVGYCPPDSVLEKF